MEHELIVLKGLEGNDEMLLTPLQNALAPHAPAVELLWWILWLGILLYVAIQIAVGKKGKEPTARDGNRLH